MLLSTLKKILLKSALHLMVKWEVVSPNSSMFSSRFTLFPTFKKKKNWCTKIIRGGGGVLNFF